MPISYHSSLLAAIGSVDSSNVETTQDSFIGNLWSPSNRSAAWPPSRRRLAMPAMPSYPDQQLLQSTFGRLRQESMEPSSNWELLHSSATVKQTGTPWYSPQNVEGWTLSRVTSLFEITATSAEFIRTIKNRLASNEKLSLIGEGQALGNRDGLGTKPVSMHTLKILGLNSGMGIEVSMLSITYLSPSQVRNTLWLTSSEEESISLIFYDGLTDTPLSWNSKDRRLS